MSRYLGEMLAFIILFMLILMMVTGGELFYSMSTYNSYRDQVVKIAQRSNGYTPEVRNEMNNLANLYYNTNRQHKMATSPTPITSTPPAFTQPSDSDFNDGSEMVNYGHEMHFYIEVQLPNFMTVFPRSRTGLGNNNERGADIHSFPVTVTSQVRDTPTF